MRRGRDAIAAFFIFARKNIATELGGGDADLTFAPPCIQST